MINPQIRTALLILLFCWILSACNDAPQSTATNQAPTPEYQSLKMFPQGKSFSGFQLTDQMGETWTHENFKGNYSVLFFGFTHCPDICPTTLLDMQKVDKKFKQNNLTSPEFTFISVDSDRDTPEVMKQYINFFNPDFHALTGNEANILSISSQLGVAYKVADHEAGDLIYDVDHTAALFILNPEGERIGLFTAPHDVEIIAADLMKLIQNT